MEPPLVTCPHCGLQGRVPAAPPGAQLACPGCGNSFPMPTLEGEGPDTVWVGAPNDPLPDPVPTPEPAAVRTPAPVPSPEPVPATTPAPAAVRTPPPPAALVNGPEGPEEAAAHLEWLRSETKRFNDYVTAQMAALDRRRQDLAAQESRGAAAFIPREQELARQIATLNARIAAAARREDEVSRREAELGRLANGLAAREAAVRVREERVSQMEERTADLMRREEELRPGLEGMEARKAELDGLLSALTTQRAEIQRRQDQLDRAEASMARRLAEVDELEQQLRKELDEQEQELTARRKALENLPDLVRAALTDSGQNKSQTTFRAVPPTEKR